jgi:hypothetical protein
VSNTERDCDLLQLATSIVGGTSYPPPTTAAATSSGVTKISSITTGFRLFFSLHIVACLVASILLIYACIARVEA